MVNTFRLCSFQTTREYPLGPGCKFSKNTTVEKANLKYKRANKEFKSPEERKKGEEKERHIRALNANLGIGKKLFGVFDPPPSYLYPETLKKRNFWRIRGQSLRFLLVLACFLHFLIILPTSLAFLIFSIFSVLTIFMPFFDFRVGFSPFPSLQIKVCPQTP